MRILYASERPPYPFFLGGAARAAHMLLARIAAMPGVECAAVGARDYAVSAWRYPDAAEYATLGVRSVDEANATLDCDYPVCLLPDFYRSLVAEIERTHPDLVWAQLEGALPVLQTANRLGVRGLCFVHDAEFNPAEMRQIAALDCHLVASSSFLADKVYRATGRRAEVVYPPAELYFDTPGDPEGRVTMINPHAVKGLDTFLELARRMPQQRFLLQESWKLEEAALADLHARLAGLPHVQFQSRVADMRAVYAQTRLLIAPSVWQEGFGMVAVEAQSCGIPVIASARGGLPESVGDGGLLVDDYRNPAAWVSAIESVLGDVHAYRAWSARALAHARSADFDPQELARRFLAVCRAPAPRVGPVARSLHALAQRLGQLPGLGRLRAGGSR